MPIGVHEQVRHRNRHTEHEGGWEEGGVVDRLRQQAEAQQTLAGKEGEECVKSCYTQEELVDASSKNGGERWDSMYQSGRTTKEVHIGGVRGTKSTN